MLRRGLTRVSCTALAVLVLALPGVAGAKSYDPGPSDTEIKIGNTCPYSGPASAYATICRAYASYFKQLNAEGGLRGRKIRFITYDDGLNPAKTVEHVRRLVEEDQVLQPVLLVFEDLHWVATLEGLPPLKQVRVRYRGGHCEGQ